MLVTGSFAVIMIVVASSMMPKCLAFILSWSVLWLATKLLVVLSAFVKVMSRRAWDVSPLLLRWAARMSASAATRSVQAAMEAVASFFLGAFAFVIFPALVILCNVLGNLTTATVLSAGLAAQAPFLVVVYVFAPLAAAETEFLVVVAVIPAVAMALMDVVAYRCYIVAEYCLEWLTACSSPKFKVRYIDTAARYHRY